MSSFGIDEGQIVGLFIEAVLYGFVLVTFFPCIYALVWSDGRFKRPSMINWPMLLVAIILMSFATLDMSLTLLHNIQAFVLYKGPGGAIGEFTNISDWVNIMGTADVVFPIIFGDGVLIYRCWIVYGKSYWVVVGPLVILAGSFVTAVWTIVLEVTLQERVTLQVSQLKPVITASTILTLVQNIITTSLIIWRIWLVDQETTRYLNTTAGGVVQTTTGRVVRKTTRLQRVMRIVVESGLILTITAIISTATYIPNSNSFVAVGDAQVQVIPIAFNLIIIRARNQTSEEYTHKFSQGTLPLSFGGSSGSSAGLESDVEIGLHVGTELKLNEDNVMEKKGGTKE